MRLPLHREDTRKVMPAGKYHPKTQSHLRAKLPANIGAKPSWQPVRALKLMLALHNADFWLAQSFFASLGKTIDIKLPATQNYTTEITRVDISHITPKCAAPEASGAQHEHDFFVSCATLLKSLFLAPNPPQFDCQHAVNLQFCTSRDKLCCGK